jgi:hypothetical protein
MTHSGFTHIATTLAITHTRHIVHIHIDLLLITLAQTITTQTIIMVL